MVHQAVCYWLALLLYMSLLYSFSCLYTVLAPIIYWRFRKCQGSCRPLRHRTLFIHAEYITTCNMLIRYDKLRLFVFKKILEIMIRQTRWTPKCLFNLKVVGRPPPPPAPSGYCPRGVKLIMIIIFIFKWINMPDSVYKYAIRYNFLFPDFHQYPKTLENKGLQPFSLID